MNKSEIREYVNHRWDKLAKFDQDYWAVEYQRHGYATAYKVSMTLWLYMKAVRSGWPEARERQQDLDNYIELKRLLNKSSYSVCQKNRRPGRRAGTQSIE